MAVLEIIVQEERVSVQPFAEKFLRLQRIGELSAGELAVRLGMMKKTKRDPKPYGDSTQVMRMLGLQEDDGAVRTTVPYSKAVLLCRALHIDPYEVGL